MSEGMRPYGAILISLDEGRCPGWQSQLIILPTARFNRWRVAAEIGAAAAAAEIAVQSRMSR